MQRGLKMTMKAERAGLTEVFANESVLRINFAGSQAYIVSRAPSWKVVMHNGGTRNTLAMDLPAYLKHHPVYIFGVFEDLLDDFPAGAGLIKIGSANFLSNACAKYAFMGGDGQLSKWQQGDYLVAPALPVALQADSIIERAFCLPQVKGFPLSLIMDAKKKENVVGFHAYLGGKKTYFITTAIAKFSLPDSYFTYPAHCRSVNKEEEVLKDKTKADRNETIKDFLE